MVGRTRPRRAATRRLSPRTSGETLTAEDDEAVAAETAAAPEALSTRRSTRIRRSQRATTTKATGPAKKNSRSSARRQKQTQKGASSDSEDSPDDGDEAEEEVEEDETASKKGDSGRDTESKEESTDENESDKVSQAMQTRKKQTSDTGGVGGGQSSDSTPEDNQHESQINENTGDKEDGDDETDDEENKKVALHTNEIGDKDGESRRSESTSYPQVDVQQDGKAAASVNEKSSTKTRQESRDRSKEEESGSGELIASQVSAQTDIEGGERFGAESNDEDDHQSRPDSKLLANAGTGDILKSSPKSASDPRSNSPPAEGSGESTNGKVREQTRKPLQTAPMTQISRLDDEFGSVVDDESREKRSAKVDIMSRTQKPTTVHHDGVETAGMSAVQGCNSVRAGPKRQQTSLTPSVQEINGNEAGTGNPEIDEQRIESKKQDRSAPTTTLFTRDFLDEEMGARGKSVASEAHLLPRLPVLVSSSTVETVENEPSVEVGSQSIVEKVEGSKRPLDANESTLNKRQKVYHKEDPTDQTPHARTPEVRMVDLNRVKILLFSCGKRVHRSQGYERLFSDYWGSVSLLIKGRLPSSADARSRRTVQSFLKTKPLRKLHNRLISGLLERCTATVVPRHSIKADTIPTNVKNRIQLHCRTSSEIQLKNVSRGNNLVEPATLQPYTTATSVRDPHEKKRPRPSTSSLALPGALIVDPHARMIAQEAGVNVTENAVWLLVVAVKEYAGAILKNAVSTVNSLERNVPLPAPTIQSHLLGKKGYVHPQTSTATPTQSSEGRICITSHHMHALTAAMQIGAPLSLGGCSSRLTFETSLFGAFDNSVVPNEGAFADLLDFMTSALAPLPEQTKSEDQEQSPTPDSIKDEGQDPAELMSIGSSKTLTETSGGTERGRSPFGGMGRGAKDLASIKARSSILQRSRPPSGPGSGEVDNAASKTENEGDIQTIDTAATIETDSADVAGFGTSASAPDGGEMQEANTNPAQVQHIAFHRKGKGAGVKNLAAMRARSLTIKPAEGEEKPNSEVVRADVATTGQGGLALDASTPPVGPETIQAKPPNAQSTNPQSHKNACGESGDPTASANMGMEPSQSMPADSTHSGTMNAAMQVSQKDEGVQKLGADALSAKPNDDAPGTDEPGGPPQAATSSPKPELEKVTADASQANPASESTVDIVLDDPVSTEAEVPATESSHHMNGSTDEQSKRSLPFGDSATTAPAKDPPITTGVKSGIDSSHTDQTPPEPARERQDDPKSQGSASSQLPVSPRQSKQPT